jgi:hypothetical protein
MTIEELFKKANNESIGMSGHKEKLKAVLLKNEYFDVAKEKEYWDWKLTVSSLALSALIIIFSYSIPSVGNNTVAVEKTGLYSNLEKSNNVTALGQESYNGESANVLKMVEGGTETLMYFNDRNVLIHSEVNNR